MHRKQLKTVSFLFKFVSTIYAWHISIKKVSILQSYGLLYFVKIDM